MTNRKALQIANSINLLAQLPDGDALVQVLGHGGESSNLEALSHWVEVQEDFLVIEKSDHLVEALIQQLYIKLSEFNSALFY